MNHDHGAAYTLVNLFTPREGATDAFIALQLDETRRLRSGAGMEGWLGNEVYRAKDGKRIVVVTRFVDAGAQATWAASADFKEHLARIGSFLTTVESIPVDLVARHGTGDTVRPEKRLRLAVVIGSTRAGRFADAPAQWIAQRAASHPAFDVTQVDLRDYPLPFLGDADANQLQQAAVSAFAELIDGFDAFVFTVAEYNHAPTAVLKNALDHARWSKRAAGLVGYGGVGGARAIEHVRGIAAELQLATVQAAVHFSYRNYLAVTAGKTSLKEMDHLNAAADTMLEQLQWWASALKSARRRS